MAPHNWVYIDLAKVPEQMWQPQEADFVLYPGRISPEWMVEYLRKLAELTTGQRQ